MWVVGGCRSHELVGMRVQWSVQWSVPMTEAGCIAGIPCAIPMLPGCDMPVLESSPLYVLSPCDMPVA